MISSEIIKIASDTKNFGIKKKSNLVATAKNSICGDKIIVEIEVSNNKIENMSYETESCIFCQASASLISEIIRK
jgi:nitrogen fixation NifU-like protein